MIVTFNGMSFNIPAIGRFEEDVWNGTGQEERQIDMILKKYVHPDKAVIDIGACLGQVSLRAYSLNALFVYALEACPGNSLALRNICNQNSLNDKILVATKAISDKTGETVRIGIPPTYAGGPLTKRITDNGVLVRTITLFDYLSRIGLDRVNIIKIDIEGAEQYIETAFNLFQSCSPDTIILLSLHPDFWDNCNGTMAMFLQQFQRFNIYDLDENICINKLPNPDRFGHFDVMLKRKEEL